MTYRKLLEHGEELLAAHGIAEARTDAWLLFSHVTGIDRTHYYLRQQEICKTEEEERLRELLLRRARHIPVQYLTGEQEFMGFLFAVNETVLIPRQDTELLVQETEKCLTPGCRVLDVCTGSGCVIISLAKRSFISAEALDISEEALALARENAGRLEAKVRFFTSDLLKNAEGLYDVIVSNPPYICSGQIGDLMPEVRDHEPHLALDGGEDGLHFYRRILAETGEHLRPGGFLLFEIGCDQADGVARLMRAQGFEKIEVKQDLAGLDRVISGRRPLKMEEEYV